MFFDYRQSHLAAGKGKAYSKRFQDNPHRRMLWQLEQEILDEVVEQFALNHKLRHLDFACGTGRILEFIEKYETISSVGVDLSPSMLHVATQCTRRARLIEVDLTQHDVLGDEVFDLVTAFRFFPNAQPLLRLESMRVLAKHLRVGGRIVFNNHRNASSTLFRLKRWLRRPQSEGMSRTEVEHMVASAGLTIEAIYPIGLLPFTDRFSPLPSIVLKSMERTLSRCSVGCKFAQNLIFVCKHGNTDLPHSESHHVSVQQNVRCPSLPRVASFIEPSPAPPVG